ncbi:ParB/RepB/Spo0J family partition protein [Cupriavidus oxalaticus]|uniref:ParB/RepB/Spo0J family partition protein n=1 Tax=Cupriavidus oxalaticus TaxID=96344 RepID=A0A5P3VTM9_9BURK|nr:ParB/RepB/Spo0J family partition protein [Cupriavidus oxalaticus]QEZ48883.1 ParB/RepB/Spo0J family partition protein [Cupriavidus oxalaticus]
MSNIREQMLAKTANIRSTADRKPDATRRANRTETAPGMAGALAAAQLRVRELEATGLPSELPVADIVPNPWQPRRTFNELKLTELAESIREVGLLQPIVVRRVEPGYQLVAGERRWRAHKMLGLENIKAVVVDCSDADMIVLALVENIGRDDLSDYEIALSIQRSEKEFPNRTRLAEAVGLSRRGLYKFMAFYDLPDFVKHDLDLQPNLLGSNAADALASCLKKHGEAGVSATRELWTDVVAGHLDQGKLAAAVTALATKKVSGSAARERSIEKFFAGQNHAGSITKDIKNFTVKIKTGILSDSQETRIRQFISELFSGTPN